MTMTVQSFEQHSKTTRQNIATYFFLEMIWKQFSRLLEKDDNVDEYFEEAVTEVSVGIRFYSNIQQRSRSL